MEPGVLRAAHRTHHLDGSALTSPRLDTSGRTGRVIFSLLTFFVVNHTTCGNIILNCAKSLGRNEAPLLRYRREHNLNVLEIRGGARNKDVDRHTWHGRAVSRLRCRSAIWISSSLANR